MKNTHLTSKDLFGDIKSRETYNVDFYDKLTFEQKADVDIMVENTTSFMREKLESAIKSLIGDKSDKYKNSRNQWCIPIVEEELFIRAYIESTSATGKKLRGVNTGELDTKEIRKEISSMEETIDKMYGVDDSINTGEFLEYITNYKILEKISEIKESVNQIVRDNMENIIKWEEDKDRFLNMDDAVYLIDFYYDLIKRTTGMWNIIVDSFLDIRNSEVEDNIDISNDTCIDSQHLESSIVLEKAVKEYNQMKFKQKSKSDFTEDELKAVKELLESYLKEDK